MAIATQRTSSQMSVCPKMHPERVREEAIVSLAGEGGTCTRGLVLLHMQKLSDEHAATNNLSG